MHLNNISIILVEPQNPGNIGSVARACKNLGISNIILINPCDYLNDDAYKMGKNAKDWIHQIIVHDRLEDCLDTHHILIGTTQRKRDKQVPYYTPSEIISTASQWENNVRVGIVFGRENNGLTNTELSYCNYQSTIQANSENSVFNLSQAVLIYAYECFNQLNQETNPYKWDFATKKEEQLFYKNFESMLHTLPIDAHKGMSNFTQLFKRLFGRACLEKRDIRLFHKLIELIKKK